jgi:branched-chain amino acid aminotransferase
MMNAPAKFVWMNGEFVPWEKATVHVLTHALHYGTGVFEGIRAYKAGDDVLIFRLEGHIRRMFDSAKIYSLEMPYGEEAIRNAVLELIKKNSFQSSLYIRPIAFKGVGGLSLDARAIPTSVSIIAYPFEKYFDTKKLGLDVCVSSWRRVGDQALPAVAKACGQYVSSVLARTEGSAAGFDEVIMLDSNGNVSEGTGENIFTVSDGQISTPTMASNILKGITRDTVINLIRDQGLSFSERSIVRGELYTCEEAFFTGTAAEVAPILSIDHKLVGKGHPGAITLQLQKEYVKLVRGENPKYMEYLTPVYATN